MRLSAWFAALLLATSACARISGSPVDHEAARQFGEAVAVALNERDENALSSLIDFHGLAMRAGAGIRAVELDAGDAPVASTRRKWSGFDRSSVTLPETDDALSRRIADILMREARRHGVETTGVEP